MFSPCAKQAQMSKSEKPKTFASSRRPIQRVVRRLLCSWPAATGRRLFVSLANCWPWLWPSHPPQNSHWPLFRHPPQIYWTATHPKPKACGPVSPGSSLIDENIFILCFLPVLPPSHIPIFPDRFPHFPCRFAPTLFLYQSPIRGSKCKNKKFKICKMAPKFALPIGDRTKSLLSQKRGHLRKQCSRYHPRI